MTCNWPQMSVHLTYSQTVLSQKTTHARSLGLALAFENIAALQLPGAFFPVLIKTVHLCKFQLQRLFQAALFLHFAIKWLHCSHLSCSLQVRAEEWAINRLREKQSLLWGSLHIFKMAMGEKGRKVCKNPKQVDAGTDPFKTQCFATELLQKCSSPVRTLCLCVP